MGSIRLLTPVKLFIGVLVSNRKLLPETETRLKVRYGAIDYQSPVLPFNFTDYYSSDMGGIIDRVFFSFEELIQADRLAEIKCQTNQIETELMPLCTSFKRPVNLDPGYMEQAKVVLASTKNFYHRIHVGAGIFAEVTMHFRNNTFQFFPWTYPDYKSKGYQEFFLKVRQLYRSQLRSICMLKKEERPE